MATTNDRVMDMVRRELTANPKVSTTELFERAKRMDSSLNDLELRQFHARYPLQIKRARALSAGGGVRRKAAPAAKPAAAPPAVAATTPAAADGAPARRKPGPKPGAARRRRAAAAAESGGSRDAVRSILLKFAGDIAAAETKVDVVQVIGGVDSWVDRLIQASAQ